MSIVAVVSFCFSALVFLVLVALVHTTVIMESF